MQLDINEIRSFIEENYSQSTLFVLKGFDIVECGFTRTDLARVIANKVARVMELATEPVKVIAFEEYLCLVDFAKSQFRHIYILDNGEFSLDYPVNVIIPDDISNCLLIEFDQDADHVSTPIEDDIFEEYLGIFADYSMTEDGILCRYNFSASDLSDPKIETVLFGQPVQEESIDIRSHYDYSSVISYPEAKQYMKRYWGYDEYRDLKIYDMDALENGQKKVVSISQEKIIGDMISQVENCYNGKPARDIFVTASTGAGKSLMFQLPAMYIAEKYNLLTLVISPLIGLMNDQVQSLIDKSYDRARTINSDISPIIKEEILNDVAEGRCDILYLSPESLLSRSDIAQLIGSRKIGMIIVDEAHIVTTWGKQFRPDYWFLGDHVMKLRSAQGKAKEDPMSFVIATFTATAIYGGNEDMYTETINSMHMVDPISYLGYVKRDNISIDVQEVEANHNMVEYELNKFNALVAHIRQAIMHGNKTLIYFPTVALINRFYGYCVNKRLDDFVAKYHGKMQAEDKDESFNAFLDGSKIIMIATKAFGMGIDIPDIVNVIHYAPTGNVCDYMQEIGRAARDKDIEGHAIYEHMKNDFQHINRLHGLSRLHDEQLIAVQNKLLELYYHQIECDKRDRSNKKKREMLIDTESFSYIFDTPYSDDDELVNKVKTAMLLIQKDYENRGISPFRMRPLPLFSDVYLVLSPAVREKLNARYKGTVQVQDPKHNVCKVDLKRIWETSYQDKMSFPKFKFMLYSGNKELNFNNEYSFSTAMSIEIKMNNDVSSLYYDVIGALKSIANESIRNNKFYSVEDIKTTLNSKTGMSLRKSENIVNVFLAAMNTYEDYYSRNCVDSRMFSSKKEIVKYKFNSASFSFFKWIDTGLKLVIDETMDGILYVSNEMKSNRTKEVLTILGVLESIGVLTFKSLGGTNSQIYIYMSSTKSLQMVHDNPDMYRNKLLQMISERHRDSVKMLTFLFQNGFTSDEIWEYLENYFIGILPDEVKA